MATEDTSVESSSTPNLADAPGPGEVPGLGDLAEAFFKSLGVTEQRYREVKVKLHLDPKCNCADRRRWLNEVGAKLGVDGVVVKLARWMDRGREK
ncbi:MAG: hypothetical protein AB7G28_04560 [Pirellulales bacterium]